MINYYHLVAYNLSLKQNICSFWSVKNIMSVKNKYNLFENNKILYFKVILNEKLHNKKAQHSFYNQQKNVFVWRKWNLNSYFRDSSLLPKVAIYLKVVVKPKFIQVNHCFWVNSFWYLLCFIYKCVNASELFLNWFFPIKANFSKAGGNC